MTTPVCPRLKISGVLNGIRMIMGVGGLPVTLYLLSGGNN